MRMLLVAALACVGCQIHLHVDFPAEELAKLRGTAPVTPASTAPAPAPAKEAVVHHDSGQPCPLDEARRAFFDGDGVGALKAALRSNHQGWRVIAASACASGDEDWVLRSIDHLTPGEREQLRDLCRRYGIELTSIFSASPRIVRTGGLVEDDSD